MTPMDQQSTALLYGFWARTSGAAEQQNQMTILSNNKLSNTGKILFLVHLASEVPENGPGTAPFPSWILSLNRRTTGNFCLHPEVSASKPWTQSGGHYTKSRRVKMIFVFLH